MAGPLTYNGYTYYGYTYQVHEACAEPLNY